MTSTIGELKFLRRDFETGLAQCLLELVYVCGHSNAANMDHVSDFIDQVTEAGEHNGKLAIYKATEDTSHYIGHALNIQIDANMFNITRALFNDYCAWKAGANPSVRLQRYDAQVYDAFAKGEGLFNQVAQHIKQTVAQRGIPVAQKAQPMTSSEQLENDIDNW